MESSSSTRERSTPPEILDFVRPVDEGFGHEVVPFAEAGIFICTSPGCLPPRAADSCMLAQRPLYSYPPFAAGVCGKALPSNTRFCRPRRFWARLREKLSILGASRQ